MTGPSSGQRWYVVQTQPHKEMRAAAHLQQQGFKIYVPRCLTRRRHARRNETVARPFFPRYIFVGVDVAAQRWRAIHSTIGVSHLVCNGDMPAPVPNEVIEIIKSREDRDGFVCFDRRPRFSAGDKIRILDGIFSACDGLFECMVDQDRVAILLDLLGRKVRMVLDDELIAAA